MTEVIDSNEPLSMADILRVARLHGEGKIPDDYKQTMPIPAVEEGQGVIHVFYGPMRRLGGGSPGAVLFPADFQARVSFPEGKIISFNRLTEKESPTDVHSDGSIGIHRLSLSMDEFEEMQGSLYQLYSKLFTQFIADQQSPADDKDREEFRTIFNKIHEKPYIYYYQTYGGPFFQWIFNN